MGLDSLGGMAPLATFEASVNPGGVVWLLALALLVGLCVYFFRRQRSGLPPVTIALGILAGAALLTLLLGFAGLIVGAFAFVMYMLSSLAF